jgi:hypothetical protein
MNTTTNTTVSNTTTAEQAVKKAKYLLQRETRQRFSFGNAWTNAVLGGVVSDKDKLVAHAVKLKVGAKSDLTRLKFETLLAKVQNALVPGFNA